jgi:hypothetical protein
MADGTYVWPAVQIVQLTVQIVRKYVPHRTAGSVLYGKWVIDVYPPCSRSVADFKSVHPLCSNFVAVMYPLLTAVNGNISYSVDNVHCVESFT